MTNIFKKLGVGIVDFGKWFAGAVQETANLSARIETILSAAKPLEAPFVAGLTSIVADVEALIADCKKMVPIATEAIQILEGKTPLSPATPIK